MVVYADVLIVLNLIVDYFLLLATGFLLKIHTKAARLILGAAVGALSSLLIFIPQAGLILGIIIRIIVCAVMILAAYGFGSFKRYVRSMAVLFGVTCGYGGIMIAMWYIAKPDGMVINNSVVYLDISPLILIGCSVTGYFIFLIFGTLFSGSGKCSGRCDITVFADDNFVDISAIIDSGNSIEDVFGSSEVIITDDRSLKKLFGKLENNDSLKLRYRVMPCSTVSGTELLDAYRCDSACIKSGNKTVELKKPILALSKTAFNDDYGAIVNPKIFV